MADKKVSALSAGSAIADADLSYWAQGGASVKQAASAIWTYIQTKFGTGVATALGINVGTAGAVVTNGGALGTPSGGTLTNATGLPVGGITGLGTGVATALAAATNATGGAALTTVAPTTWTPTDQSGASLSFTSVSAQYVQIGNLVFAYGTLTYPSTADGTAAKISLPVAVPNQAYATVTSTAGIVTISGDFLKTVINSSTATFQTAAGATLNSTLSLKVVTFMLIYPAS